MNNNNDNNQNNYVNPEQVDFSKVTLTEHQDGFLNRERDKIVNATIQANSALDENVARTTNNTIKVKKSHPFLRLLLGVILIAIAVLVTYEALKISKRFIESGKETTTVTTTVKVNQVSKYLNSTTKARKFDDGSKMIILSPIISGLTPTYITVDKSTKSTSTGKYKIENNVLNLYNNNDEVIISLIVGDTALVIDGTSYKIMDDEFKCYANDNEILIVNANLDNEFALIITSEGIKTTGYEETLESITLEDGNIYIKSGMTLNHNGSLLELKI